MFTLDHDYHLHSTLSTCCEDPRMIPENIIPICREEKKKEILIANHFWDRLMPGADDWYGPQDLQHVKKILPLPEESDMRVRFGCETEFCGGKKIGIAPETYDEFEFIVVPFTHLHNHFSRPRDCTTPVQVANLFMDHFEDLLQIDLPWKKVGIPHLTCFLVYPNDRLKEVFEAMDYPRLSKCFDFLAEKGAGIELNAGCFGQYWKDHLDVMTEIYRVAKKSGCKFYCASDAHSLEGLRSINANIPAIAEELGLTDADRYTIPG